MDSDPPPRSPQLSRRLGSVEAFRAQPQPADPRAGQWLSEPNPMPQQGQGVADDISLAAPTAPSFDPEDLLQGGGGEEPEPTPGRAPEGPGPGLAAPLIGALIGLLTLVLPMVAVLDDRPGHPLAQPLPRPSPALGAPTAP